MTDERRIEARLEKIEKLARRPRRAADVKDFYEIEELPNS